MFEHLKILLNVCTSNIAQSPHEKEENYFSNSFDESIWMEQWLKIFQFTKQQSVLFIKEEWKWCDSKNWNGILQSKSESWCRHLNCIMNSSGGICCVIMYLNMSLSDQPKVQSDFIYSGFFVNVK